MFNNLIKKAKQVCHDLSDRYNIGTIGEQYMRMEFHRKNIEKINKGEYHGNIKVHAGSIENLENVAREAYENIYNPQLKIEILKKHPELAVYDLNSQNAYAMTDSNPTN